MMTSWAIKKSASNKQSTTKVLTTVNTWSVWKLPMVTRTMTCPIISKGEPFAPTGAVSPAVVIWLLSSLVRASK